MWCVGRSLPPRCRPAPLYDRGQEHSDEHRSIRPRLGVEVGRIERAERGWVVHTDRDDLLARNVVVASGLNQDPVVPEWAGREEFAGELVHATSYRDPAPYRGRDVLVVGTGNTGAELCLDLVEGGALRVRLSVRTPPHILPRQAAGIPGQVVGIAVRRLPPRLVDALLRFAQRAVYGDLAERGLPVPRVGGYSRLLAGGGLPILDIGLGEAVRRQAGRGCASRCPF